MLKKLAAGLLLASLAVGGVVAWRASTAQAENNKADFAKQPPDEIPVPANNGNLKPAQKLPITQVVLFNSGVGYFHRSGEVEGEARVDLQFSAADINDLIKSLIVSDAKGQTVPLRYDSQEPIEKTLKSFAIDLSTNPSYGQILNQMRGQKVELTLQTNNSALSGLPGTMTGTIVGMETAHRPHSPTAPNVSEMELLTISCAEGLRSVPLPAVQRVRFLNPAIENEFRRALEVVAVGHDSLKKTVHLGFKGEGKREVKVGYVVENPIWKTSYRLVKGDNGKWRLQAWANVENTSDDDWNDIKLTLVSSRPISFQMDLYPPLFIPRPTVEPALFASLRPPTYGGPITNSAINVPGFGAQGGIGFGGGFNGNFNNINPAQNGIAQNPGGNVYLGAQGGVNGLTGGGQFGNLGGQFGNQGGQFGMQGGQINSFNKYQNNVFFDNNNGRQTFEQMQAQRNGKNNDQQKEGKAKQQQLAQEMGSALTNVDPDLIERARAADVLGQPARFSIDQKVSLPRQQSIMLPILDEEIDAAKVSIFNERVHATRPLHGLKMKNKTKQALMSGPVTVYEGETPYSGDARLLDLQPDEERYLSYALDTGVEIKPYDVVKPGPEMTARMENGQLSVQYKMRHTRTYVIVNRSPEARRVVIEQPVRTGWKLVKPEKPSELTTELYRFDVDVKAGETVKYEVSEELPRIDPFAVSKQADWTGFATSLGLDVWTEIKRTPEDSFLMQIVNPATLQVTHKDRRSTTYFFRNRTDEDRTVWLEHNVLAERQLIGNAEPVEKSTNRYRFKLDLKKGQTLSYAVSEELRSAKPEAFPIQTLAGYATAKPGEDDGPAQRFVTELGFEVWQTRKVDPEAIVNGRFVKGELHTSAREVETATYHIRNRGPERTFVLEHQVRPNWAVVGEAKPVEGHLRCVQFTVKAAAATLVRQPVGEERVVPKKETLAEVNDERLKVLLASAAIKDGVKEALRKAVGMRTGLEQTVATLKDLRGQVKDVSEEQSRLRTNMEKLPPTSELYKRYLGKLDTAETGLEKLQTEVKDKETEERKLKKEYEGYLEKLNVE
jgi:hypothetical protein